MTSLHQGGFAILRDCNLAAYKVADLSDDTPFGVEQARDQPRTTEWFSVPPTAPYGQTPKQGTLHPSLKRAVQVATRQAAA